MIIFNNKLKKSVSRINMFFKLGLNSQLCPCIKLNNNAFYVIPT